MIRFIKVSYIALLNWSGWYLDCAHTLNMLYLLCRLLVELPRVKGKYKKQQHV